MATGSQQGTPPSLPCHKTHFLLVLGITRCDVGTKDNTTSGDEEAVTRFDASIPATNAPASGRQRGETTLVPGEDLLFVFWYPSQFVTLSQ